MIKIRLSKINIILKKNPLAFQFFFILLMFQYLLS